MKAILAATFLLVLLGSCAETSEVAKSPPAVHWRRRDLFSKAEWIERLVMQTEASVDLVEAVYVITNSTRKEWRPPEEITQSLAPILGKIRKRIGSHPSADAKIAALNALLLPTLTDPRCPLLPWIYEVFKSDLGGCVPSCLIYLMAADSLSLTLEPVMMPGHIFVRYRTADRIRTIETTSRGESLSVQQYRDFFLQHSDAHDPIPDDPTLAEKAFYPLSRRQLAALLIALTAQKYPASTSEEDLQAAIQIAPEQPALYVMLGNYYRREGKNQDSEKMISHAIALAPGYPIFYQMRWGLRKEAGQLEASLEDIDVALKLVADWPDYHVARGVSLSLLGRRHDAFQEWTTAVTLRPDHAEARRLRAEFLQKEQRIEEAIQELSVLIEHGSVEALDLYNRGVLHLEAEQLNSALGDLSRSVELDPKRADTWRAMGNCKVGLKRYGEAIDDLTKAVDLAPLDARGYWLRSRAYAFLGDEARYDSDLRRFHELNKNK